MPRTLPNLTGKTGSVSSPLSIFDGEGARG